MFCFKCGKEIPTESIYCLYCGVKIPPLHGHTASEPSESLFSPISPSMPASSPWDEADFELPELEDDEEDPSSSTRRCTACGRVLPESSVSDECITCLHNRSFVAIPLDKPSTDSLESIAEPLLSKQAFQLELDLDQEYPSAYAEVREKHPCHKKTPRKYPVILIGILVCIAVLCFLMIPKLLGNTGEGGSGSAQTNNSSNLERKITSYAREITKNACANPDSVSFHKDAVLSEQDDVWTVTETFDRTSRQGEFATTTYIATLRLDSTQSAGYTAIKLQIDDTIMFDYS